MAGQKTGTVQQEIHGLMYQIEIIVYYMQYGNH